jgi:hypothetical protein
MPLIMALCCEDLKKAYSPECVEVVFSELPLVRIIGS